jgi:RING-finger-containing ubiquitin ligase
VFDHFFQFISIRVILCIVFLTPFRYRVERVGLEDIEGECLICMDSKIEVSLPCAHSFCQTCIGTW